MHYDKITLLFLTCEDYSYLWSGFFKLFKKYFPDFDGSIQSNIEADLLINGYFIKGINKKYSDWGSRTYFAIRKIKTPFVFLMLDDFFLFGFNKLKFDEAFLSISQDNSVGVATLFDYNYDLIDKKQFSNYSNLFYVRNINTNYYSNLEPAIWRTHYFKRVVRKGESAWEFETFGTYRSWHYKLRHLYPIKHGVDFLTIIPGGILTKGKANAYIDIWPYLKKEGVEVTIPPTSPSKTLPASNRSFFISKIYSKYYLRLSTYFTFLKKPNY